MNGPNVPELPGDLPALLEDKWGRREAWGGVSHWGAFIEERMAFSTPNLQIIADLLADRLALERCKSLDVGCGEGGLTKALSDRGSEVVGAELDPRNLAICRAVRRYNELAPGAFVRGTGVHLPFRDASFDLVTSVETIEHVNRPESLVAEMFRVVRPGGHVLVTTPNALQPYESHARMLGVHWLPSFFRRWLVAVLGNRAGLADRIGLVEDLHYFTSTSLNTILRDHAASIVDLRELWLKRLLSLRHNGEAMSDPFAARLLEIFSLFGPERWPRPVLQLLLAFMPLKFLCRKRGSES